MDIWTRNSFGSLGETIDEVKSSWIILKNTKKYMISLFFSYETQHAKKQKDNP